MQLYYGTKKVLAKPMTLGEYNTYMGWVTKSTEVHDETAAGYLVEYLDSPNSNHINHENYISWSPAEVFDAAYQMTGGLSFGHAIVALKEGAKISRTGWNGKNMFLYYVKENHYPVERNTGSAVFGYYPNDEVPYRAYIAMKTAQDDVVPWVASQSDILANDWYIFDQ